MFAHTLTKLKIYHSFIHTALPKRKNNTTDIDRRKTHFFHNALSEIRINNSLGWLLKLMFFTLIGELSLAPSLQRCLSKYSVCVRREKPSSTCAKLSEDLLNNLRVTSF